MNVPIPLSIDMAYIGNYYGIQGMAMDNYGFLFIHNTQIHQKLAFDDNGNWYDFLTSFADLLCDRELW